uniref:Uncharacterized protein n=1 Tax=Parascaris univalens TaxID=6257 RepID=A0A915BJK0_PARUN
EGIVKSLPSQSSMGVADSNRHGLSPLHIHRISETTMKHVTTSGPKTAFERQVQDFRERLWGNNGFGDIIKAIQNANIGFYGQPTYNRSQSRR